MKNIVSYTYKNLELELFKTLNNGRGNTVDILEIDRDQNGTYSFTLLDKCNKQATLHYSFDLLEGIGIEEFASILRADFNKVDKETFVADRDNYKELSEDDSLCYIAKRSLQYFMEGYPLSHIPSCIGYRPIACRKTLKYYKDNIPHETTVPILDLY
ncbi:hypothetical protein [Caldalkalibacillus salinus]|uniref:hypothetical protein n=1 Tax=Caldalkalibacillus salinus TaxID=2803787 RepID=UPI0019219D72|nr:hypothetical protein [Caldalkalibacillus salinus]